MGKTAGIKAVLLAIILFISSMCIGSAQATDTDERAELIALDDAWIDAEVGHDKDALEQILDERFLATFSSGKTIDRTAYIEWIMNSDIKPFTVIHESIQIHDDVAVVIDRTTSGKTKFTWIAVRKEVQWRVISETFTKVTEQQ